MVVGKIVYNSLKTGGLAKDGDGGAGAGDNKRDRKLKKGIDA